MYILKSNVPLEELANVVDMLPPPPSPSQVEPVIGRIGLNVDKLNISSNLTNNIGSSGGGSVDDDVGNEVCLEGFMAVKDTNSTTTGGGGAYGDSSDINNGILLSEYILGSLIVRVVSAKNVKPAVTVKPSSSGGGERGLGEILFGTSPPRNSNRSTNTLFGCAANANNQYVKIAFGNQTHETSPVYDTVDPVFPPEEQSFFDVSLPVPELAQQKLDDKEDGSSSTTTKTKTKTATTMMMPRPHKPLLTVSILYSDGNHQRQQRFLGTRRRRRNPCSILRNDASSITSTTSDTSTTESTTTPTTEYEKHHNNRSTKDKDICLGTITMDMTPLLTGMIPSIDQWLSLTGPSNVTGSIRILCEYAPSDPMPRPGDIVRFTGFVDSLDIYPIPASQTFRVDNVGCGGGNNGFLTNNTNNTTNDTTEEENNNMVLISYTSPENWLCTFQVHRLMLICAVRHQTAVERYQDELQSLATKIAYSPALEAVSATAKRLHTVDGIVSVGRETARNTKELLGRWYKGGRKMIVGDLIYATNFDGRHTIAFDDNDDGLEEEEEEDASYNLSYAPSSAVGQRWREDDNSTIDGDDDFSLASGGGGGNRGEMDNSTIIIGMPCCPISNIPMVHPVVAADGHTYEKANIAHWMGASNASPITGIVLQHKTLVPNYLLLSTFQDHYHRRRRRPATAPTTTRSLDG